MRKLKALASGIGAVALAVLSGCSADAGTPGEEPATSSEEAAATGPKPLDTSGAAVTEQPPSGNEEVTKACSNRADWVSTISSSYGYWGDWAACMGFCPAGSFAYGVYVKSEPSQGSGADDTALNGIQLGCYERSGARTGFATSTSQRWGSWGPATLAQPQNTDNPLVSVTMKVEAPQGSGDDTAANAIAMGSRLGGVANPGPVTPWGTWAPSWQACAVGTAICGIVTRVEDVVDTFDNDDTALNGAAFACCTFQ